MLLAFNSNTLDTCSLEVGSIKDSNLWVRSATPYLYVFEDKILVLTKTNMIFTQNVVGGLVSALSSYTEVRVISDSLNNVLVRLVEDVKCKLTAQGEPFLKDIAKETFITGLNFKSIFNFMTNLSDIMVSIGDSTDLYNIIRRGTFVLYYKSTYTSIDYDSIFDCIDTYFNKFKLNLDCFNGITFNGSWHYDDNCLACQFAINQDYIYSYLEKEWKKGYVDSV